MNVNCMKSALEKEAIFRNWVKEYTDVLYSYAIRRLPDAEAGKDIVQETFLAAWRNMDAFRGEASVKNWLFVILKRKIIDQYQKSVSVPVIQAMVHQHDDRTFFDEDDHWRKGMYPGEWSADFSDPVAAREFYTVLSSCSKKLKDIQNTVFVMKYLDGLDSEEICKTLGITSSNYWVLLHRAKVQLRACLEKNWLQQ